MSVEDQEETLDRWQEVAGYLKRKDGGGYREDVPSISVEDFKQEIRRGVR